MIHKIRIHKSRTSYVMPALIYALLVGTTFSPDVQPFLAKTFGAAPFGVPVALVVAGAVAVVTPDAAPLAAEAAALASSGRVSTLAVVTGRDPAAFGSTPGGITRSTWPTSITFGLSRLFHLTRSFQF